jgi:hypothetical protein
MGTLVIRGGGQVLRLPLRLVPPFDVTRPVGGAPLNSPAVISFRQPTASQVLVRVFASPHKLLGRRVVVVSPCFGRCERVPYTVRIPFSVAGLQQGYVVISPLHPVPNATGQVVEIPVALNGG